MHGTANPSQAKPGNGSFLSGAANKRSRATSCEKEALYSTVQFKESAIASLAERGSAGPWSKDVLGSLVPGPGFTRFMLRGLKIRLRAMPSSHLHDPMIESRASIWSCHGG